MRRIPSQVVPPKLETKSKEENKTSLKRMWKKEIEIQLEI